MTRVCTGYSKTVADVTGDMSQRAPKGKDLEGLEEQF